MPGLAPRIALVALALLAGVGPARAAERVLQLDASRSRVLFQLGATLHRVEGTARLATGAITFEDAPGGGAARGLVRIDARSAETGIARRDRKMHDEVLESQRFPWIELDAERLAIAARDALHADVTLYGRIRIHGSEHPLEIPARIDSIGPVPAGAAAGSAESGAATPRVHVSARFVLPYVAWGMKDVSTFVLRVERTVTVEIEADGQLTAAP